MGDGSSDSRSTSSNLGAPASPLRIFTRVNNSDSIPEDCSPGPREAAHALLGNAFSRSADDESDHGSRPSSSHTAAVGKSSRAVAAPPRAGRHGGGHYHPLPSHWRGQDSSPSSVGSPVTPDSGGSEDPGAPRILPLVSSAGSQVACTPEPFRPYHNSHSYNTVKSRGGRDQSPASTFYAQVGSMGDAFGSVSSLEWTNDRPGSTHSYRSTDQPGNLHASDAQAESPADSPGYSSRFVPALGALAARSGAAQRSALGVHAGPSRHHPSASTSSSHYSYGMNSPPVRGMSAFGSFKDPSSPVPDATAVPVSTADGETPVAGQSEDIVRRYFGLQRQFVGSEAPARQPLQQQQKQPQSQQSPQSALSPLGKSSSESSGGDEASGNIVYRRAVSSGDLPTLEELHGAMQGNVGNAEFLTHDLVESPLEALVRRLTIELFQLYVSEDRKKSNGPLHQQQQQQQQQLNPNDEDDIAQSLSRVLDPLSTDEGYVQQFRLGPSLRSGSTTPAVTMDGYFMPQAASGAAETGSNDVRPRPRHRLLERTWMEEALIKARRVSTIDENAEETILQGLEAAISPAGSELSLLSMANSVVDSFKDFSHQDSGANVAQFSSPAPGPPRVAKRGQALQLGIAGEARGAGQRQASGDRIRPRPKLGLTNLSEEGSEASADDGAGHTMSPRSHYRARDPAAPHRKLPAERRHKNIAAASISPARASLLRAVGRRQSIRLQPGKGQIVVAETMSDSRSPAMAGDRSSIVAPVTLDPDIVARAKRTNSLPGIMSLPETKEVSYRDIQRKAARKAEFKKAAKSRGRYARRAERMVRGGTQPSGARGGDGPNQGGRRRHGHHRRMGSRADMEQQLVRVELPPPVPLRVRREQVRIVPEPLIIVRPPVAQVLADDVNTTEQKIQRVHNQLLGAQAVLSRHNSVMRQAASKGSANKLNGSKGNAAATSADAAVMAVQLPGKNTVRNLALDAMMLEGAFDEDDDVQQQKKNYKQKHHEHRENPSRAAGNSNSPPAWRSARRRSTLRRKERAQQEQQRSVDKIVTSSTPAPPTAVTSRQPMPIVRRLLLHGPVYKIYSSLRARSDAYLFLFTDILVVAVRVGGDSNTSSAPMTGPSTDASMIPTSCRFRVQLVIPLVNRITTLRAQREGASKRAGEDDDAEERRITSQEDRIRRACHMFEKNTSEAVVYLINHEIIGPNADMVAGFLHRCTALSRRQTGSFLGAGIMGENLHENPTSDEVEQEKIFHQQTWISYLDRCNIVGVPIDEALRSILLYFRLPQNRRSTGILLEIAALQWFTKNKEFGTVSGVYIPESQDVAVKLVFTIMMLNSEVHNPMIRSEAQSDAVYHAFLQKFRASVVDDPALAGKRKGNVLRKRDQPRVVTVMEVPTDVLKAIYERVLANRLVTCSDTYAVAPEFEIDWIRDPVDVNAPVLTDEEIENEIEDIYCDPGFRDGILFNATSDRLPAKFNIEPEAWVRVTVRIPEADPKFALVVRVLGSTVDTSSSGTNSSSDPVCILPSPRLTFQASNTASFVIRPQQVGHFTLHFVPEGTRARYYHPIPPRSILVEGGFMRQAVQVSWKRGDGHHGRHMFGLDSSAAKNVWVQHLNSVLKTTMDVKEVLRGAEKAAQTLIPQSASDSSKGASNGKADATGTAARGTNDHSVSSAQLMSTLGI
ncbi:hypothetical protein IWW36_000247 [Coemansia brasiliensis]|uniref:SEC7 domain-containing protein n=1 Tax=Coemansia brasiliensis TaxID=2650707 RepID=A0A9W8M097_9FUNG|nr:hypothetical protein IWW36_000247 [Coemansia brasiliensis]